MMLSQIAKLGTIGELLPWAQVITPILALGVVIINVRSSVQSKKADVTNHFHKQFDELQKKRVEINLLVLGLEATNLSANDKALMQRKIDHEVEMFFDRFWSLQFDEFVGWFEGYVRTELFTYWAYSRCREMTNPTPRWQFVCNGVKHNMATTFERINAEWKIRPFDGGRYSKLSAKFLNLMNELGNRQRVDPKDEQAKAAAFSIRRAINLLKIAGEYASSENRFIPEIESLGSTQETLQTLHDKFEPPKLNKQTSNIEIDKGLQKIETIVLRNGPCNARRWFWWLFGKY